MCRLSAATPPHVPHTLPGPTLMPPYPSQPHTPPYTSPSTHQPHASPPQPPPPCPPQPPSPDMPLRPPLDRPPRFPPTSPTLPYTPRALCKLLSVLPSLPGQCDASSGSALCPGCGAAHVLLPCPCSESAPASLKTAPQSHTSCSFCFWAVPVAFAYFLLHISSPVQKVGGEGPDLRPFEVHLALCP